MIKDELKNYSCYVNCNSHFEKAFEFLLKGDFECCRGKRFEIDGTNVYAESGEFKLRSLKDAPLEAHDRYIDIQYCIKGEEDFGWSERKDCTVRQPYDNERDIVFFDAAKSVSFSLVGGEFAIFYPEDAHAPLVGEGTVEKIVVKVKVEK